MLCYLCYSSGAHHHHHHRDNTDIYVTASSDLGRTHMNSWRHFGRTGASFVFWLPQDRAFFVALLNLLRTSYQQYKKNPPQMTGGSTSGAQHKRAFPKNPGRVQITWGKPPDLFRTSASSPGFMELKSALQTCGVGANPPHTFSTNLTPSTWIYPLQKHAVPGEKSPDHHDGDICSPTGFTQTPHGFMFADHTCFSLRHVVNKLCFGWQRWVGFQVAQTTIWRSKKKNQNAVGSKMVTFFPIASQRCHQVLHLAQTLSEPTQEPVWAQNRPSISTPPWAERPDGADKPCWARLSFGATQWPHVGIAPGWCYWLTRFRWREVCFSSGSFLPHFLVIVSPTDFVCLLQNELDVLPSGVVLPALRRRSLPACLPPERRGTAPGPGWWMRTWWGDNAPLPQKYRHVKINDRRCSSVQ